MSTDKDHIAYRIDASDTISWLSPSWLRSACATNSAQDLEPSVVVGRSLWEFITGHDNQQLFRLIVSKVRDDQQPLDIPFRCDNATARRFMSLEVCPLATGHIEFTSRCLREETRESVVLFEPNANRSEAYVEVCSWCKQVNVESAWVEVEIAVRELAIFDNKPCPRLTHSICSRCANAVRQTLERRR